jgi:hypothetical protein
MSTSIRRKLFYAQVYGPPEGAPRLEIWRSGNRWVYRAVNGVEIPAETLRRLLDTLDAHSPPTPDK